MDENENKALNQEAEAENSPATSPVEESNTAPEVDEQPAESEQASEDEVESKSTEGEGVKKRSAQGRIRELVKERDSERVKAANLSEEVKRLTDRFRYTPENLGGYPQQRSQAEPEIEPGAELTLEEYKQSLQQQRQYGEQDALRKADYIVQLRMAQQENLNRINTEANEATNKYEVLNPKSDNFDPELSDAVTRTIGDYIRANPTASVKKMVDRLMKPYVKSVTKAQANATESAAKQVSEAASRPTPAASQGTEKDINKMTWKEIEDQVGIVG